MDTRQTILFAGQTEADFVTLRDYLDTIDPSGLRPVWCDSAEEVLARLKRQPPAVLLLDQNLTGDSTTTFLVAAPSSDVPIIVLTHGTSGPHQVLALRQTLRLAGAHDTLPYDQLDVDQLERAVRGALEQHALKRAAAAARLSAAPTIAARIGNAAEQRLLTILESSRDAVYQLDLATERYDYCSGAVADVLGISVAELMEGGAALIDQLIYAGDVEPRAEQLATMLANTAQPTFEIDYRLQTRHQGWRWLNESRRVVRDANGAPHAIVGSWRDVTLVRQTLETLSASERRYRRIIETTQEGVCMLDMPWTITYVNPRTPQMLGYNKRALLGRSLFDFVVPDQRAAIEASFAIEAPSQREIPFVHQNGSTVWCIVDTTPLRDRSGVVTSAFSMLLDITARKRAQDELDRFFMLSPNLLAIAGLDGFYKRLNPAWEQTIGWSTAEMLKVPFLEFVHPEDLASTLEQVERLSRGAPTIDFENRYRCSDGTYRWLAWKSAPDTSSGEIYSVAHDITERNRVEAELLSSKQALQQAHDELELRVRERTHQFELAKNEAERANAAKSEFLSRMSHELRTPLNSILGFAQIMEMDGLGEKQAERLGYVMKAGRHLLQLINEVLDLARVESGRLQVSPEPVCVEHTIQRALDMVRPLAAQHQQQLMFEWRPDALTFVRADQQRLAQVLLNLLSNATKYTPDGGLIQVSTEDIGAKRLRIRVTDSGNGIAPEHLTKLFTPFERLNASFSEIEGTGLGLALSKRLVELMGGQMGVESQLDQGSSFWIDLPLTESALAQVAEELADGSPIALDARHHVLYIEDNLTNLQVIQHVLESQPSITLLSAGDGEQGLALARAHRPALILLDLHLPTMLGDEVLRRLRLNPETREIPVVMISADATPRRIRKLMDAGAADYLTKPLDIRLFLDVVQALLRKAEV